jgi:hypothetical protein
MFGMERITPMKSVLKIFVAEYCPGCVKALRIAANVGLYRFGVG